MTTLDPTMAPVPGVDPRRRQSRGTNRGRAAGAATSGPMSLLSLFLLLLAFFILLNSMAEFERTRTDAVLGSVNDAFSTGREAGDGSPSGALAGTGAVAGMIEAALRANLRLLLTLDRFAVVRDGSVVGLEVDAAQLYGDGATPAAGLSDLAARVAGALDEAQEGHRFEIEALARIGFPSAGGASPEARALAGRRAGSLVRALEQAGIGAGSMLAGIEAGDPGRIRIEVRVLAPLASSADSRR